MTTPSQTVGPFFALPGGLPWPDGPEVVAGHTPGAVVIAGRVVDGAGQPVADALIETWQADADGRFAHPDDPRGPVDGGFRGFGRAATDAEGRYRIVTVKPGPLPTPDGRLEAPHLTVSVFARGLLDRLVTRIYFPDEAAANAADPVLRAIDDEAARRTLIARPDDAPPDSGRLTAGSASLRPLAAHATLRFDIHLQGPDETAFFTL